MIPEDRAAMRNVSSYYIGQSVNVFLLIKSCNVNRYFTQANSSDV